MAKRNPRDIRSFGPAVIHMEAENTFRAVCTHCAFRIHTSCTHVRPSRTLPDGVETPDWCEMKAGMLKDAMEMVAKG
jgi:hypothetical protein